MHEDLDRIFSAAAQAAAPGAVIGVDCAGKKPYRHAFGLASIEGNSPNTMRTRMHIGSATKQFTCFAVLLLAEEGRLSIDDDLRLHLPELPQYRAPVRIRDVMSNSSGLRCYLDLIGILAGLERTVGAPLPVELQLAQRTVNFPSGARFAYCNGGYMLLTRLVERLANVPFATFLSQQIFEPLGMSRTTCEPDDTTLIPDVATLHQRYPDGTYHRGTVGVPLTGDGAIVSDVDDMLRWLQHMESPVIGNKQTWQTFLRAGSDAPHRYGFGLMHVRYRGIDTIQHGGTVFGGRCQTLRVPGHGINIAMMSNASDVFPSELTERVLDVLLEDSLRAHSRPLATDEAGGLAGTYYSETTGDGVTIVANDGQMYVDGENGPQPLNVTPEGTFRTLAHSLGVTVRPANGSPRENATAIELTEGGVSTVLHRVERDPEGATIAAFAGTYKNADCEADATVSTSADGTPSLSFRSPYGSSEYRLEHVYGPLWFAHMQRTFMPVKLRIRFEQRDDTITLSIRTDRTMALQFVR